MLSVIMAGLLPITSTTTMIITIDYYSYTRYDFTKDNDDDNMR